MEKGIPHILAEIIEYMPDTVVSKTILEKRTGSITAISMAIGEEIGEINTRFDTYIQIIDGAVELTLNGKKMELKLGQGIIIPANALQVFHAPQQCKMITTIMKSGYED